MNSEIANLRNDYAKSSLNVAETSPDPITQFRSWFEEARKAQVMEPNAMTLSTATADGHPSGRIVLVKDVTDKGFVFFTNYESRKGKEIAENAQAALTFFWPELERQVRIEGRLEKVSSQISDAYFGIRPRGSQLGAWSSPQSQEIPNRSILEGREKDFEEKFQGQEIPRPAHWGGYELIPDQIEFWQGRQSRLHDRILYEKEPKGWIRKRLAP